jgi:hypothetical protein
MKSWSLNLLETSGPVQGFLYCLFPLVKQSLKKKKKKKRKKKKKKEKKK